MQQAAADVLRRSMRARSKLRNSLLLGMAAFASRLPEDYPEVWALFHQNTCSMIYSRKEQPPAAELWHYSAGRSLGISSSNPKR